MVAIYDSTGYVKHPLYYHLSVILRGFYEGYSLGKNHLGEHFPKRDREADSYGGNSIWGQVNTLIGQGWTWNSLMWGVSWANIMLTMLDAQRTDYKSDKKNSNASSKSNDNGVIDLSDAKNIEFLKKLAQ